MKVEFRFNGEQQIILIPENNRDKKLMQMFADPDSMKGYTLKFTATADMIATLEWIPQPVNYNYTINLEDQPTKHLQGTQEDIDMFEKQFTRGLNEK